MDRYESEANHSRMKIKEALRMLDQLDKELDVFQQRNYEHMPFLMELTKQIKKILTS